MELGIENFLLNTVVFHSTAACGQLSLINLLRITLTLLIFAGFADFGRICEIKYPRNIPLGGNRENYYPPKNLEKPFVAIFPPLI